MASDWDKVTVLRKKMPTPKPSQAKTPQMLNQAMRQGLEIETSKKYQAGTNKKPVTNLNTKKLDEETEIPKVPTIGMDVGRIIQRARNEKGLTQKDLATRIAEKPQVVNEYEQGKGVPNQQVLAKMERVLGVKLRGKDKGQPLGGPKK